MNKKNVNICFIALLIAVISVGLCACDGDGDYIVDLSYPEPSSFRISHTGNANIQTANLTINWGKGSVIIRRSDDVDFITFEERYFTDPTKESTLHWRADGDSLRLAFCRAGEITFKKDFVKDLTVLIPSDKSLNSVSVSGLDCDVSLENVRCTDMDISVSNGSVSATDCAANLNINVRSARVKVDSAIPMQALNISAENSVVTVDVFDVERLSVKTSFGSVSSVLRGTSDQVDLRSGGSISASLYSAPASLYAQSDKSNVYIKIAASYGFTMQCSAKLIAGTLKLTHLKDEQYSHSGVGQASMRIKSDAGTVYLDPLDVE